MKYWKKYYPNKLHIITLFFYTFYCFSATAQNLIPDPGFEIYSNLPDYGANHIYCLSNWTTPNGTNADYYNKNSPSKLCGVPVNIFGSRSSHSGDGYAGICISSTYTEYLQTGLTTILKKGDKYLVEMFICKAKLKAEVVTNFGVLFEDKPRWGYDKIGIETTPPIFFYKEDGYRDSDTWTKLSMVYTAKGYEKAIIIGYFIPTPAKKIKKIAHYYIDDISITLIKSEKAPIDSLNTLKKDSSRIIAKIDTSRIMIGKTIRLENIYFETEKSVLLENSNEELNKLVNLLKQMPGLKIKILGHTDNQGNESFNKKLSEERAKAVKNYLVSKGIDESRLSSLGYGSEQPIESNETKQGREKNRRVEFLILQVE